MTRNHMLATAIFMTMLGATCLPAADAPTRPRQPRGGYGVSPAEKIGEIDDALRDVFDANWIVSGITIRPVPEIG